MKEYPVNSKNGIFLIPWALFWWGVQNVLTSWIPSQLITPASDPVNPKKNKITLTFILLYLCQKDLSIGQLPEYEQNPIKLIKVILILVPAKKFNFDKT